MERSLIKLFSISLLCLLTGMVSSAHHDIVNFGLVVHGGSGMYSGLTKARAKAYKEGIDATLVTGYKILEKE